VAITRGMFANTPLGGDGQPFVDPIQILGSYKSWLGVVGALQELAASSVDSGARGIPVVRQGKPKTQNHLLSKYVPDPSLANEYLRTHPRRTSCCTRTPSSWELFCDGIFFVSSISWGS